jgi:hypothetical protein
MKRLGLRRRLSVALVVSMGVFAVSGLPTLSLAQHAVNVRDGQQGQSENDLTGLSNEELIDRLRLESQGGIGTQSTSTFSGFLPLDDNPRFQGGILGSAGPYKSAPLTELVRRGVAALPALIKHLSDTRPTKLTVGEKSIAGRITIVIGGRFFLDEYDPRSPHPEKQPTGVNKLDMTKLKTPLEFETYTLKVGDFCYVAIGQIVNRNLNAVRYQMTASIVVNSPIQIPALAKAVKQDWGGLTAKEHEHSLYQDALRLTLYQHALRLNFLDIGQGALVRMLYYYPSTGRPLALKLLNQPLFDFRMIYDFFDKKLVPAAPDQWAGLLKNFKQAYGEGSYRGLLGDLIWESTFPNPHYPTPQMNAEWERAKHVASKILARFFPGIDPYNPPFLNAVDFDDQQRLVEQLASFEWKELDDAIYQVYQRAIILKPSDMGSQIERDDLALACAEHLAGKGHDDAFFSYFEQRLSAAKRDYAVAQQTKPKFRGDSGWGPALDQRIGWYEDFLKQLAKSRPHRL